MTDPDPQPYTHTYLPPPPAQERGPRRGMPWWGIVLLAVGTFVSGCIIGAVVMAAGVGYFEEPPAPLTVGTAGDIPALDGQVGDCFQGTIDSMGLRGIGAKVDCEEQHELEVYARFDAPVITDGEPSPYNEEDMEFFAGEACYFAFERYVGTHYDESSLEFTPLVPAQDEWRGGERAVHCLLHEVDGDPIDGSAKGTNR